MRIRKISAPQFRCNFCLDWHVSKYNFQPPSSINVCENCYRKIKTTSHFKVLDPESLEVYELRLRKTGLFSDESRSINIEIINDLLEFYSNNGDSQKAAHL